MGRLSTDLGAWLWELVHSALRAVMRSGAEVEALHSQHLGGLQVHLLGFSVGKPCLYEAGFVHRTIAMLEQVQAC